DEEYPFKHREAVLKIHERLPESIHGAKVPSMNLKGIKKMRYNILKTLYKPNDRQWSGVTITNLASHILDPADSRAGDIYSNLMEKYRYDMDSKKEWQGMDADSK